MKFQLSKLRKTAAFTLAELTVVGAIVALLAVGLLPSLKKAMDRSVAQNTIKVLGEVKNGKEQFRAAVLTGSVEMPAGMDADTLGTYTPALTDLAPYIKAQGVQEGAVPTADQLMAGTGKRVLSINALDTDPTCSPAVPAEFQVK